MCAATRSTEEFAHLVGEAAGDGKAHQLVVVLLDGGAQAVGVHLHHGVRFLDDQIGHADVQVEDHVVHRERLGVARHVQPGRLLVAYSAAQQQRVFVLAVGAHHVGALVDQLRVGVDAVGVGDDVVEVFLHTQPSVCGRLWVRLGRAPRAGCSMPAWRT